MRSSWMEIHAHNRELKACAERWELRIHIVALVITAIVLGMRLVAGTQDLTMSEPSGQGEGNEDTAADIGSFML